MIKFTLTALLIQCPALFIQTIAVANPQNVQEFLPQISLEDDVVPPRMIIQAEKNADDDVVPPR